MLKKRNVRLELLAQTKARGFEGESRNLTEAESRHKSVETMAEKAVEIKVEER